MAADRSVEEVYDDYKGRRLGLLKAITSESDKLYNQCDPALDNLSLYGLPNGEWEVNTPVDEVPPEIPEPILGINFSREGMRESDWLAIIAVHSDAWLVSVAFYLGARFGFGKTERARLFSKINRLPTLYEILLDTLQPVEGEEDEEEEEDEPLFDVDVKEEPLVQVEVKAENGVPGFNIPPNPSETQNMHRALREEVMVMEEEQEQEVKEDDDDEATLCGACMENYVTGEFWICCDMCETWYHGKCVRITPARAEYIKHYKCPGCNSKRPRI